MTRILFILLVIINVAYLAWQYNQPPPTENEISLQMPQGARVLTLLREDITAQAPPEKGGYDVTYDNLAQRQGAHAVPETANRRCYTLGPLREVELANKLAAGIEALEFKNEQRALTENEQWAYWVFLPPYETRARAQNVASQLASKNVKDYFIVGAQEEGKNAISLGVYSKLDGAKKRYKQIKELGFEPQMRPHYREVTLHWIDYEEWGTRRLAQKIWQEGEMADTGVRRIDRSCE